MKPCVALISRFSCIEGPLCPKKLSTMTHQGPGGPQLLPGPVVCHRHVRAGLHPRPRAQMQRGPMQNVTVTHGKYVACVHREASHAHEHQMHRATVHVVKNVTLQPNEIRIVRAARV